MYMQMYKHAQNTYGLKTLLSLAKPTHRNNLLLNLKVTTPTCNCPFLQAKLCDRFWYEACVVYFPGECRG